MGETDRPKSWFFLSLADRDAKGNPQIRAFFEKLALEVASSVARARRTWRDTASGRTLPFNVESGPCGPLSTSLLLGRERGWERASVAPEGHRRRQMEPVGGEWWIFCGHAVAWLASSRSP